MPGLPDEFWSLGAVALLVFCNGFFVATEFALVSVRRTRIDELVAKGVSGATAVQRAIHQLDRYIAGTQVGITLASLALGWIGEPAIAHFIEPIVLWVHAGASQSLIHGIAIPIAFVFITILHVVLGELVPKSLALQMPERVCLVVGRPMWLIVVFLQPLIWSLNGIGNLLLRAIGMQPAGEYHGVHSVDELEILVRQSHKAGVLDDLERQILQHTFRFSERTVSQVMVPRSDIKALDLSQPVETLLADAAESNHSRLPAFEGGLDNIVGIIYVLDLFRALQQKQGLTHLRDLCRPALLVPEGVHIDVLLDLFRQRRTQLAVVVNEYGSTSGLITFEDIIEEVTGEVQDTLEAGDPPIEAAENGQALLRGDVRLDELNDYFGWNVRDDSIDTIAGFVMNRLGRVATVGDLVEVPECELRVIQMNNVRITRVLVVPHCQTASDPGQAETIES
ncbi:MAG: hemolysin family protein [Isosphaeraceae bacterium]